MNIGIFFLLIMKFAFSYLFFHQNGGFGTRLVKPHPLNFHSPQGLTIDGGFLKTSPPRVLYDISDVTIDS